MKRDSIYTVGFRRKRKSLTNYRKRVKVLSAKRPRLVVRKSLKNIQASIVEYNKKGDIVRVASHSQNLKKFGWNYNTGNIPAAYLVGYLLGKKAKNARLDQVIFDIGLSKSVKGSRLYSVLAGALDAGLNIPCSKEMLPSKERLSGAHIAGYAQSLKKNEALLKKQFGACIKNKIDPENITKNFEQVKGSIDKNFGKG
ncbi:50S ribosomal protein L18 [Candidatus Woesearchaeota archaeon]|nr:50S ribosomal protein L18 [Candidatus Woesearchaeota archaeon]